MTQDEIIRMAREAGAYEKYEIYYFPVEELERFAALVAAHEREACAKVCDDYAAELDQNKSYWDAAAMNCAAAIRARGQHE